MSIPTSPLPESNSESNTPPPNGASNGAGSGEDGAVTVTVTVTESIRTAVATSSSTSDTARRIEAKRTDFSQGSLTVHLVRFGSPLVVAMLFMAAFNLIDIFIVGRLRDAAAAVTVVSICDALLTLFVVLVTGIGNASIAFIARALGNRDLKAARDASTQAFLIVGAISAMVFVIGLFFPHYLMRMLGVSSQSTVFTLGVEYLRVALVGGFTMFFVVQFTSILRGIGNSVWPTVILIVVNALNIILAIVLVLGPDENVSFGLGWGVIGAAWAALIARIVGFVMCLWVFYFGVGRHYVIHNIFLWRPNWAQLRRLLAIGLPSSAQLIVRVASILGLIAIIFHFRTTDWDTTVGTTFALCSKLDLVALFMALGWGQATSTIVGQMLGAKNSGRAERSGWIAVWLSCVTLTIVGVVFFAGAPHIVGFFFEKSDAPPPEISTGATEAAERAAKSAYPAVVADASAVVVRAHDMDDTRELSAALEVYWRFFTADAYRGTTAAGMAWLEHNRIEHELVIYHGTWYVRIMVFAWVAMGIGIVLSQAMTGAGATRTPAMLDTIVLIVLLLPAVAVILGFTPLAQRSVWVAVGISHGVLAALYVLTFRRGKWKLHPI